MKLAIQVIDLIRSQKWEGVSEDMEIAKGKNEVPDKVRDVVRDFKRKYKMLKKKHFGHG